MSAAWMKRILNSESARGGKLRHPFGAKVKDKTKRNGLQGEYPDCAQTGLRGHNASKATPYFIHMTEDSDVFLSFRNVKKTYDRQTLVVRDFNLDVRRGEFVTLLGPSGSGKTTVLMMLAGFEHVSSGDIRIGGASITRVAPYERNIGMVFQNYALFPHMTVAENLAYP